jgi:nucleotide-binding universal stress UspA family protein
MMKHYKNILVPLDGSELAETALTDALSLAELSHAKVILFQAVKPAEHVIGQDTAHPIYLDQQWASQKEVGQCYLIEVQRRITNTKLAVETVVEMGPGPDTIIDYAHDHGVDLIVMATHGRSGLSRWVYGSVADKVLRGAEVPVLLVRARIGKNDKLD